MAGGDNSKITTKPLARIMVVDDERDITFVLKEGLESGGFFVKSFTDSALALQEFREHSKDYCLALVDIRMPDITGFQLAREFQTINPDVKKVLMSAFEMHKKEVMQVLPSVKVDDFITKPVRLAELRETILKHIGNTKIVPDNE